MKRLGSSKLSRSSLLRPNSSSAAILSSRSLVPPSFTFFEASKAYLRILSCSFCLSPPLLTASISISSTATKGRFSLNLFSMTLGYTTRPPTTLADRISTASVAINISGMANLLMAESSKVLSIHWVAWVYSKDSKSDMTNRERAHILSDFMGFRL